VVTGLDVFDGDGMNQSSTRDVWRLVRSIAVWQSARSVVRSFGRARGFAVAAILTVALGLGANSVVFSLFDRLLFRPLPYREPNRLVQMYASPDAVDGYHALPLAVTLELARADHLFSGVAWPVVPERGGDLEPLAPVPGGNPLFWLTGVTTNTLEVLGIRPVIGAGFQTYAATPLDRPVLLTYDVWQQRYGGSNDVLSLSWTARDPAQHEVHWQVVGVLPDGFLLPSSRTAAATFDGLYGVDPGFDRHPSLRAEGVAPFARLAPGVTPFVARARVDAIVASHVPGFTYSMPGRRRGQVSVVPLQSGLSTVARSYVWLAVVGAWAVLGSTCLTLALLLLTWSQSRQQDAGIRLALGASPRRLVVSTLAESMFLCGVGTAVGWIIYLWAQPLFVRALPPGLRAYASGTADPRVMTVTCAVALVSAVVAGVLPAIRTSRTAPLDVFRSQHGTVGFNRLAGGPVLLALQAAFGLILLVGSFATLPDVVRTLWKPPGFDAADLYLVDVPTSNDRTASDAREQVRRAREAVDVAQTLPGVIAASLSLKDPLWPVGFEKQFLDRQAFAGRILPVDSDFFTMLGTSLVAGRTFSRTEVDQQALVAVVNESGARILSPGASLQTLVGQTVTTEDGPRVIVGVVEDFRVGADTGIAPAIFLPLSANEAYQHADTSYPWASYSLILRMASGRVPDVTLLSDRLRKQPWALPRWVGARRESVADKLGLEFGPPRLLALVFGTFGGITLVLAVIAIYGLASFELGRRREEMTIRLALGASPRGLRRRLAAVTVGPVIIGLLAALPVSWLLTWLLARSVPAIDSGDPWTYTAAAASMLAAALVAAWMPGWRSITMRVAELLRSS
jgi:predicted permease